MEDLIITTKSDNFVIELNTSYLYIPVFISDAETQTLFNESIKNSFKLCSIYGQLIEEPLIQVEIINLT